MGRSWWCGVEWNCVETWSCVEGQAISGGYWCRRCRGRFQSPGWSVLFVCLFEGGRQWRV